MADVNVTLKRNNGAGTDNLHPKTNWSQVESKPSTFTPTAHSHGNITDVGAIGTTSGLIVKTTTSGVLTTLAAGSAGQFLRYDGTWDTPAVAAVNDATLTLATGTGISLSAAPTFTANASVNKTITITNSAPNVTTDISITHNASTVVVNSSDGADGTVNGATTSLAGVMTAADKTKLDGIAAGAQVNVGTNIAQGTRTTTTVPITSSTGSGATLDIATTALAGVMSSADKTKLDGIAAGAQVNVGTNLAQGTRTTTTVPVTSSTGSSATLDVASTTLAGMMSSADKTKLDGIAAGAQVNVGTDLSWTAGTTAGPTVNSSTGADAVIPSASSTASGVITTGAQDIAGVKNFTSTPTVNSTAVSLVGHNHDTAYVAKNGAITGATKTKITYDSKGLVTAGADATLDDIADGGTRKLANYLPLAGGTLVGALSINSTLSFRAAATANTATQIPVFIADPSSTTRTLVTRTPAQFRSDIGAGTGTISSVSLASGTNNGTLKLTVDGSATDNIAVTGLGSAAYTASTAYRSSTWAPAWSEVTSKIGSAYGTTAGTFSEGSHKYHPFSNGQYFFDTYEQGNYFRLFTEIATFDQFRFQPISDVEYYNGAAWVAWSGGDTSIKLLLDGREETGFGLDHTHRRFRFTVQRSGAWPTLALLVLHETWTGLNHPNTTITIETWNGSAWVLKDTTTFGAGTTGNSLGIHIKATSTVHDGIANTRVTVLMDDWTDSGSYTTIPLRRLMFLSNFNGGVIHPWTWNYDKVVDFKATPTVNSTALILTNDARLSDARTPTSHTHYKLDYDDGPRDLTNRLPTWSTRAVTFDFVNAGIVGGTGNYGGVMTYIPWTGTTSGTGDSSYQLAFANLTGVNASGIPALKIRNGIDSTWNAWHTFYHTGNKPTATDVGLGNVTNTAQVTSVSGTANQISVTAGTTPVVSLATGYGDTLNPYASKTQKTFLAAPNAANGVPTFRAILASDVPTLNQSTTGSAGSVANSLIIKSDSGTTEGTDLYTFNGSAAKTLNLLSGTNVTLTEGVGSIAFSSPNISITDAGTGAFITDVTESGHTLTLSRGNFTETQLSKAADSGTGNVVTDVSVSNHQITLTKGITASLDGHTHLYAGSASAGGAATNVNVSLTDTAEPDIIVYPLAVTTGTGTGSKAIKQNILAYIEEDYESYPPDGVITKLYVPNIKLSGTIQANAAYIEGNVSLRAAATSSAATQIPIFIADPASTTRTLVTRTPSQLLDDTGVLRTYNDTTKTATATSPGSITQPILSLSLAAASYYKVSFIGRVYCNTSVSAANILFTLSSGTSTTAFGTIACALQSASSITSDPIYYIGVAAIGTVAVNNGSTSTAPTIVNYDVVIYTGSATKTLTVSAQAVYTTTTINCVAMPGCSLTAIKMN